MTELAAMRCAVTRAEWDKAITAYDTVHAAIEAWDSQRYPDAIDQLSDMETIALRQALMTPAPDGAALAAKLRIYHWHELDMWREEIRDPIRAQMLADASALGTAAIDTPMEQQSPATFDPDDWIRRATDGGLTFFAREGELWCGQAVEINDPTLLTTFSAELDEDARQAVIARLEARGLSAVTEG